MKIINPDKSDVINIPDRWRVVGDDEVVGLPAENEGLIMSELGGKGNQLRYFIVIATVNHFVPKSIFKTEVIKTFNSFSVTKTKLEQITLMPDHIRLTLLINMNNSVDEIVMSFVKKINSKTDRLVKHYFVVNTDVPNDREIQEYVNQVRKP